MKRIFAYIIISTMFSFCINSICLAKTVVYNAKTHKYHSVYCQFASKCTKDCIKIDGKAAIKLGGVPCKACSK